MRQLYKFLYRNRAVVVFAVLEIICGWIIVQNNRYQSAAFYTSSNAVTGQVLNLSSEAKDFVGLRGVNDDLVAENQRLKDSLQTYAPLIYTKVNSPALLGIDQYSLVAARVVNNTISRFNNHITLNRGQKDSVLVGMGVIGPQGVVGKVRAVSQHFATVTSLLNTRFYVSAKVQRTQTLGSVKWNGEDPQFADMLYLPRHVVLQAGDSVVTSGFDGIFPPHQVIGIVTDTRPLARWLLFCKLSCA